MNWKPREVAELWRHVAASFPLQPRDERTPEVWERQLPDDLTLDECIAAVDALAVEQPRCTLADVVRTARASRARELHPRAEPGALAAEHPALSGNDTRPQLSSLRELVGGIRRQMEARRDQRT